VCGRLCARTPRAVICLRALPQVATKMKLLEALIDISIAAQFNEEYVCDVVRACVSPAHMFSRLH
jgi:hypothetical protein